MEVSKGGGVRFERFFEFPTYHEPDLQGPEAYEAVDAAVTSAVRRQLVSDVPIGTFLSGGIDSPLVAAKMRAVSNGSVLAFTIGTNGDRHDESADAMAYAREMGVEHVVEQATADISLQLLNDVVAACSEPFADYSIFPTLLVSRLARERSKSCFREMVATNFFGGTSIASRRCSRKLMALLRSLLHQAAAGICRNYSSLIRIIKICAGREALAIFTGLSTPTSPKAGSSAFSLIFQTGPQIFRFSLTRDWNRIGPRSGCVKAFVGYLTMILLKVDRASMYHSLEVRVPLLDKEVVEVATHVDWRSCLDVKRKLGKLPLRNSLARHVRHQTRTKRGFTVPMDAWLRGPLKPFLNK